MIIKRTSKQPDIIFISGDAYVDHPSFGIPLLTRYLEYYGFSVNIIAQPDIQKPEIIKKLGKPKLFYGISAGNMDSMIANYTALKYPRKIDSYSENGKPGLRPNRATIVYTNIIRSFNKDIPIIIGGIEASLRRIAHYDYWQNKIRASILEDSNADMLLFGMAETSILSLSKRLSNGENITNITNIRGSAYIKQTPPEDCIILPSLNEIKKNKLLFWKMQKSYDSNHRFNKFAQFQNKKWVVLNRSLLPLEQNELDKIYSLPFSKKKYSEYKFEIPALKTVENSIISHRGCYGQCSFCSISIHQGKIIQSRSINSIISEIKRTSKLNSFKGTITDVGGPSANMFGTFCKLNYPETCKKNCVFPNICSNLDLNENLILELLRKCRNINSVKHIFTGSGIRFDMLFKTLKYFKEIIKYHISGQMKIAPEHTEKHICNLMKKPNKILFQKFLNTFYQLKNKLNKNLYIIPYYICAHPGSTNNDMKKLSEFNRKNKIISHQIQIFTPTPMSVSTCMYYTGLDEFGNSLYCAKDHNDKRKQTSILFNKNKSKKSNIIKRKTKKYNKKNK